MLDALESHSAVLFVTCNESAGDCMDGRLQSRFHVCLQLPELTSATRGQIWQKCLESHKDMTFFSNPATLAHWTLNGREIANAVVAAKTLATNGVLEIKHLERVVPAGRRVVPIADDPWDFPLKKGKKKKSKKAAVEGERSHTDIGEIIEEPPKVDEDAWAGWGFGPKNKEKEKAEVRVEPEKAPEVAPKLQDDDWGNWVIKMRDRQPKKPSDEAALPPPAPPAPPVEAKVPAKDKTELDDIWGSFGAKKSKKSKKAVPNEPDPVSASIGEGSREAVTAPPEVDDWSFWASSKKEKKKKKGAVVDEVPLVVEAHISEARGITSCAPPALSCVGCRTCVEYEPVREGRYCKRCGTREGNFKIVCEPCAMTKGYNQFALRNVPCEVCGNLNP